MSAAQIQANYGTALNVFPPTPVIAPTPQAAPPPQEQQKQQKEEVQEESQAEETLESLQEARAKLQEELREVEDKIKDLDKGSVAKSVEKLAERYMIGRLSKTLRLNESGKQKLFDYFENKNSSEFW